MRKFILLSVFLVSSFTWGQSTYEVGVVIDSIAVADSEGETFALYLPENYSSQKLSSIVFVFEPAARGKVGLLPFLKASEKYNHILVCSNNSRNGPYDRNFAIANRLFNHVFGQFAINKDLVFLSGFSGGSRLAATIAALSEGITGVIACGAGLSTQPSHVPYGKDFLYAGICGTRDMNYTEMLDLMPFLESLKFSKTLFTYDAGHRWPPGEKILEAFDWLHIELHKKGVVPLEENVLKDLYIANYDKAEKKLAKKEVLLALEDLNRLRQSFGSFYNLDSITTKIKNVRNKSLYKISSKEQDKAIKAEQELTRKYLEKINKEFISLDDANINWWGKEFQKLKKQHIKGGGETKKMIERVRYKIFASFYQRVNPNINPESAEKQRRYSKEIIALLKESSVQ